MKKASFDAVARALSEANVPFLVVGGIAVIHHGYGRLTQDVDLVIRLEPGVILRAFRALAGIGYHPAVPITAEQFADPALRGRWKREKGMKVLKFWSDLHRETPLDVFIDEPFDFASEYAAADVRESLPGLPVRIVILSTLLAMKQTANRPQDIADIDELNLLHRRPSSYDRET
jgi:predicted nucleotidyltransferase